MRSNSPAPFPHRMIPLGRQTRHDPVLGHAFVSRVRRRVPHEHGAYFSETNAEGFREDHDLASVSGCFHVMCYGDSYAAGDGVDNQQRFSALLASQLGMTTSNVAVPGHGPDQNVLQLEQCALPRPDLILWCIAVQTVARVQSKKRITIDRRGGLWQVDRPHFVLAADGSLQLHGVPVAELGLQLVEPPAVQMQQPLAARTSRAVAKLRSRLVRSLGSYIKSAPDSDYTDAKSAGWQLLAALVRRFHASANGTPVVIVPLPTSRYLAEANEPHFQRRFGELERTADGLHVLDVVTHMRQAPRSERAAFHYRLDGHYTETGHVAVAAALTEQLRSRGLVPEAATNASSAGVLPSKQRANLTLHVGWQLNDGYAQLRSGAAGDVLSEHRESQIVGHPCRPGVLPLSAVQACLEAGRVAGPELRAVILHSPGSLPDALGLQCDAPQRFEYLSGWLRWHGGAECDLRTFLCYKGPVTWQEQAGAVANDALEVSPTASADGDDAELRWMRQQVQGLPTNVSVKMLERVARRWQLITRAARESVLPTTAPLRRGRMAHRLAHDAEAKRQ